MAMTIEIKVPEAKAAPVKFPCVMRLKNGCCPEVWFSNEIGFFESNGQRIGHDIHLYPYVPVAPGTEAKLVIESEDGTEFPRVVKHCVGEYKPSPAHWLMLDSKQVLKIAGTLGYPLGTLLDIDCDMGKTNPLPPGTKTTITIRDGKISCEIELPKDWLPVTIAGVEYTRSGEGFVSRSNGSPHFYNSRQSVDALWELCNRLRAERKDSGNA